MTNPTPSPAPAAGGMAQQPSALMEARRALRALYLEVPEAVARDVSARVEAAFTSLRPPAPEPERAGADAMREALRERLRAWQEENRGMHTTPDEDELEEIACAALGMEVSR